MPTDPRISIPEQPTILDIAAGMGDDGQVLEQGQRIGPYRIDRLLGMGGMGAVYLAEQLEPIQRQVALKLIRSQMRGGLAEAYFLVERQALARMDHPAIAKVFDAGTTPQGHLFFAMEWIDGETLTSWCRNRGLPLRDTLRLFVRVCLGVQHAHQKGVIHRDLKPGNVLVVEVDGSAMPKIIDFGVATGIGGVESSVSQSVGTRGYMSPEQARGKPGEVDMRTDVYSLGVILLELLAPREVLAHAAARGLGNDAMRAALLASLDQKVQADPDIVRDVRTIPAPLRWLIAKAIDPSRSSRYESAQKLADDIDHYLLGYPVKAVPPTRTYRLRCFVARNRVSIVAASVVAAALVAGTTAAVIGMVRARESAQRANLEAQKAEQTARFLTDVLAGVDPEQARDLDKTLLHLVLDGAANRASRELANQPEVLANIEYTIGSSYNSLSEYRKALEHTQHAYDAARSSIGPDALLTLQIQRQLARQTDYTGKGKEAAALLEQNIAALTRTRGAEDPDTIASVLQAVETANNLGNFDYSEKHLKALLPVVERVNGHDGKLTIVAMEDHAVTLTYLGRYEQAEPLFRDVIARETRRFGAESPKTLDTMNEFAIMYLEMGRFADGAAILEKLLPIDEKLYGPDHSATMNIVSNLAGALRQQETPEKIAASGPLYLRAYNFTRKKFGDMHGNTIIATGNYGNYLLDVGDVTQAIAMEQTAAANALKKFGPNDNVTGEMEFQLGKALLAAKRYDEAEKPLLAAIAEKQRDFGADHWRMGGYIDPLIANYKAWGKPELAAQWQAKKAALKPRPPGES